MFFKNITVGLCRNVASSLARLPWKPGVTTAQTLQQSTPLSTRSSNHLIQGHYQFNLWPRLGILGNISSVFGQRPGTLVQPCRTKTRGNTYQPSVTKRIRKHGWKARLKTKSGIKVILRRKLKGRRLLTHVS